MPLGRVRDPFSHSEWLYEIKWDGFRGLAYVHKGECRLISRNGNQFKSFDVCRFFMEDLAVPDSLFAAKRPPAVVIPSVSK
jgi:hypothetical protein